MLDQVLNARKELTTKRAFRQAIISLTWQIIRVCVLSAFVPHTLDPVACVHGHTLLNTHVDVPMSNISQSPLMQGDRARSCTRTGFPSFPIFSNVIAVLRTGQIRITFLAIG
jgi:hypothetical protein